MWGLDVYNLEEDRPKVAQHIKFCNIENSELFTGYRVKYIKWKKRKETIPHQTNFSLK